MKEKNIIETLVNDIKNGTSHSVQYLKSNSVEETLSKEGIDARKIFSSVLRPAYLTQTDYKLIIDHREPIQKNKNGNIFLVNHRQADDIVLGANVVNKNGYILFGNPDLVLETSNGLGLWANGMILVVRGDELSRKASIDKMRYVLSHGGNIIVWFEGYWNLSDDGKKDAEHKADDHNSDNWLIQEPNIGAFKLAQELGSNIIPTVLHYDEVNGKKCYGSRLSALRIGKNDDVIAKKDEFVEIMQTELYRLMGKYSTYVRADLESCGKTLLEQYEELREVLIKSCDIEKINYKLDLENEKLIGKCKFVKRPVTVNEEAFDFLSDMVYNGVDGKSYSLVPEYLPGIRK